MATNTAYEQYINQISDIFFEGIKNDNLKFNKPWTAAQLQEIAPHNPMTKNTYKGLNSLVLEAIQMDKNYKSGAWLTFNQIKALGGSVQKGEKSTPIGFFTKTKKVKTKDTQGQDVEELQELKNPIFKKYAVFNLEQTTGIEKEKFNEIYNNYDRLTNFNELETVEKIIEQVDIDIIHRYQEEAYYSPSEDKIFLPNKEQFKSETAYYSTLLHELGHATGHTSRLNRNLSSNDEIEYAKEELRAEIYSYLQAKELGIGYDLQNHQSYVKSWASILDNNKFEMVEAIRDSLKMVKYVNEHYIEKANIKELQKIEKAQDVNNIQTNTNDILNAYNKSNYGQYHDKKFEWQFSLNFKELNQSSEPHIFWDTVYNDMNNKNFNIKDLYLQVTKSELNEYGIGGKEVLNKKISILEHENFVKSIVPSNIEKYFNEKSAPKKNNNNDLVKLPLHKIIENVGYDIKRDKTSANSIVMSNGAETLVISKKPDENYLYYNVHNKGDKGTIWQFAKNRGLKVQNILKGLSDEELKNHHIKISSSSYDKDELVKDFQELKPYNKNSSSLSNIRAINPKVTKDMNNTIKIDKFRNVVFPTYSIVSVDDKNFLTQTGTIKKLLEKPLTHDKEGKPYDKPLKSLSAGGTGLAIVKNDKVSPQNIKAIVTTEDIIDTLSYAQLNKIDLDESLLVAFNGSMKQESVKAFEYLIKTTPNLEKVIKAFDNDKQGNEYDHKINTILKEQRADIKNETHKSISKDWNEDLKKQQEQFKQKLQRLNINPKELRVEREKGEYTL